MGLLELLIIVLVIAWAMGSFVFPVGNLINVLLVIVVIVILIRVLRGEKL